ncbi:MAG: hypothetical protein IKA57_06550 [Clostridia bacterium]|nr:hypothetical protein [Clostridia bacterium]
MKKKIIALASAALMMTTSVGALSSCKLFKKDEEEKQKTVMNVCLNPEVEFLLDGENKVISVNAINEEGNLIISSEAFSDVQGKTAEEAAKLFVQVSKETGYLVQSEVQAGENELKISLSGDTELATTLYNSVETQVKSYLETVDIQATVQQQAAITEEQLKVLVEECAPYVETAEMQYVELVNTLIESRKETAEFYSQELKEVYYEAKAFAMEQASLEVMRDKLSLLQKAAFDVCNGAYNVAVKAIEAQRYVFIVGENSAYNLALKALQQVKIDYIKARTEIKVGGFTTEVKLNLEGIQARVAEAEEAIHKAAEQVNKVLDEQLNIVSTQHTKALDILAQEKIKAEENLPKIAAKRQDAQKAFFEDFEKSYGSAAKAVEKSWSDMETALRSTVSVDTEVEVG